MGQFIGQVPEEVRTLANLFDTKAGELETLVTTLNSQVQGTQWVGADRERFVNDTWTTIQTSLNQAAQILRDTGTTARNNATEQDTASA